MDKKYIDTNDIINKTETFNEFEQLYLFIKGKLYRSEDEALTIKNFCSALVSNIQWLCGSMDNYRESLQAVIKIFENFLGETKLDSDKEDNQEEESILSSPDKSQLTCTKCGKASVQTEGGATITFGVEVSIKCN